MKERKLTEKELEEIRDLYKFAKDKREQVRIICELYLVKQSTVRRLLNLDAEEAQMDSARRIEFERRANDAVKDILENNITYKRASSKYGISQATISRRLAEVMR